MTLSTLLSSAAPTIGGILAAMVVIGLIETAIPLRARGRWNTAHLGPNIALTFITFATNLVFNGALVLALGWLASNRWGVLPALSIPPAIAPAIVVVALDFSFYVAHVTMHHVPTLWRFHSVHHSDPAVDVTTTIRQHPGEGVIRYAFLGVFACALGAGPGAFAVYRAWSALNAVLEHANIRLPRWLDDGLSLVTTWPNMHKVHHSRIASQTNSNYGNIFSVFDRAFGTFTPSRHGTSIVYGLDGLDDDATQTVGGLLALPFRHAETPGRAAVALQRS